MLLLIVGVLASRRPNSIALSALMGGLAATSFLSVISLSVDWVFAAYLALYVCPPAGAKPGWRRNLVAQGLALAAVFAIFVLDRLPAVVVASQRFGEPAPSIPAVADWAWRTIRYLFPTPVWLGVASCGVLGLLLAGLTRGRRTVACLAAGVVLVNLLHFVLTNRCPYPRVCGYFLPLVLLGLGYLTEVGVTTARAKWTGVVGLGVCCGIAVLVWARQADPVFPTPPARPATTPLPDQGVYAVMVDADYVWTKLIRRPVADESGPPPSRPNPVPGPCR